ncbi:MAG: beta-galactosidase [Pseudomonadota bacterium]
MQLGVCYFPEHWPEAMWAEDAARMVDAGLSLVRIGEFAWSRYEPEPECFDFGWYERALETLHAAGLKVIACTPTATPPKWLIDRHPDILAHDRRGTPRKFGSRRHYCFSSPTYRSESQRITRALAERFGEHPAITAWQTDNEYGCHDTTQSYSPAARDAFRLWLAERYGDIAGLNTAWGNVFWSMEYRSFDEIDLPMQAVTELNPSHVMAFKRFSSDQVRAFNAEQIDILRNLSPGRKIIHNFMGFVTDFDHHAVGADLDVASWDAYPLGFLEQFFFSNEDKARRMRVGHPDLLAFHHDLYRGCSPEWAVMELQPGPVNWAAHNPAPLQGAVELWALEALAHGASFVSWFRWRQAPFAQEQMHAGLLRPDSAPAPALDEARAVADLIPALQDSVTQSAPVALLFDYADIWSIQTQPQGASFNAHEHVFSWYAALRRLGFDVDILNPDADLTGYSVVCAPQSVHLTDAHVTALEQSGATLVFGPRTGSKTPDLTIPDTLAPGSLQALLPLRVTRTESLRPDAPQTVLVDGNIHTCTRWREEIETELVPRLRFEDGGGLWYAHDRAHYIAAWPDDALLTAILGAVAEEAGLVTMPLGDDLRVRRLGDLVFAFNYSPEPCDARPAGAPEDAARFVHGGPDLPPAGVAIWTA